MRSLFILLILSFSSLFFAQPNVGEYSARSVSDPLITNKAETALLFLEEENQQPYHLIRIREAWSQVVAGTNYRLILELETDKEIEVWEVVLFENFKEELRLTEKKIVEKKERPKFRKVFPSKPGMTGVFKERGLEEPEIQTLRDQLIASLKTDYPEWEWVQAHQVAMQVVAGMRFFFLIEVKISEKRVILETILSQSLNQEFKLTTVTLFPTENPPEKKVEPDLELTEKSQTLEKIFQQENPAYQLQTVQEMKTQWVQTQKNYWFQITLQKEAEVESWKVLVSQEADALLTLLWKRQIP
ncbi:MAG: cystatin domain-containing protein [Planctomycetota bacterium]